MASLPLFNSSWMSVFVLLFDFWLTGTFALRFDLTCREPQDRYLPVAEPASLRYPSQSYTLLTYRLARKTAFTPQNTLTFPLTREAFIDDYYPNIITQVMSNAFFLTDHSGFTLQLAARITRCVSIPTVARVAVPRHLIYKVRQRIHLGVITCVPC